SDSKNWFASTPPSSGSATPFPSSVTTASAAPGYSAPGGPAAGPSQAQSDAWQRYWSEIVANGWRAPIFLNADPPTAPMPTTPAGGDSTPPWPPSQSLLGLIPYLPPISVPAFATSGFFSIPVLDEQSQPQALLQKTAGPNSAPPSTLASTAGTSVGAI